MKKVHLKEQMGKFTRIFKITIIFSFLYINNETRSQEYKKIQKIFTNIYTADSLFEIKEYRNAIKYYHRAKDGLYSESIVFSKIAKCYFELGDSVKSLKYNKKTDRKKIENSNINEELKTEFLKRKETDQMYRGMFTRNDSLWKIQKEYDRNNQRFLDSIINKYGWPGFSLIGKEGTTAAFLLAQHADSDLEFQEKCLKLMKKSFLKKDINRQNFAYLMDRVLLKKYEFQLFGSQCMVVDDIYMPLPLYDKKIVNTLRKYFEMGTLEGYLKGMQDRYNERKKQN